MSHKITKLSFGKTFPGQVNPLDDTTMNVIEPAQMFTYYMKLVPTIYSKFDQKLQKETLLETNQYSVTWYMRGTPLSGDSHGVPGLFFNYEISPILVRISSEKRSLLHFFTNTCAIIGGVFTVASLVDAFIYRSTCAIRSHAKGQSF
ncbi:Endoplasmic reticulum-Golgi intermediate compartment protein 3 [Fasciola hepatica]|uniref:Endoplasmic reticulum-Golgi intermediate compartment protein 3 n=1 Tax=Fasciola hepatica TaxID=6192 RepID=A0A4E0RL39_FASHE|nr:Endoplasmic reticulum-Golgi intermediate compartment protein 3 [Fasciola hepatica]